MGKTEYENRKHTRPKTFIRNYVEIGQLWRRRRDCVYFKIVQVWRKDNLCQALFIEDGEPKLASIPLPDLKRLYDHLAE